MLFVIAFTVLLAFQLYLLFTMNMDNSERNFVGMVVIAFIITLLCKL